MKELNEFFDIDFVDTNISQVRSYFDIDVMLSSGESIRFFIYPDALSPDFRLSWYGGSADYCDTVKIDYITSVTKIANKLNNKENLLSIIDIVRKK